MYSVEGCIKHPPEYFTMYHELFRSASFWAFLFSVDEELGRVVIDYDLCVSCQMCMAACPYGATMFDVNREIVFKCNLCDGNPQCVHFCEPKALVYKDVDDLRHERALQYASKIRRY